MFVYEKKLQYPVKIKNTNPKLAALIISQYGGPYPYKLRKHPLQRVLSCCIHYLFSRRTFASISDTVRLLPEE